MRTQKIYKLSKTGLSAPFFDKIKAKANDFLKGVTNGAQITTTVKTDDSVSKAINTGVTILAVGAIATALILKKK